MSKTVSLRKAVNEWRLYLFILPAILFVGTFSYFPALSAIYHSFFDWQGGDAKQFIGLANFAKLWTDPVLWGSFVTIGILILANVFKMMPSILMAVLIHRMKNEKAQYWYRVMLVIPMIVPSLVTLFIWKFFYDPNMGVLNQFLDYSGMKEVLAGVDSFFGWNIFREGIPIAWLSDPRLVIPALIFWGFPWIGAVGVLIYLSGLQAIGTEIYEAADLDGAGSWSKFRHIELPLIMTQVRLSLVLMVIGTLQGYGLQYLLLGTNGGPEGRGMVPGLWMFNKAFVSGEFGYACAVGILLFFFILILTFLNNKYVRVDK